MTLRLFFERLQQRSESCYKYSKWLNSHLFEWDSVPAKVWLIFGSVLILHVEIITEDALTARIIESTMGENKRE